MAMEENANTEVVPVFLSFSNVCTSVNKLKILQDVSGKVRPGELMAIMGPSGEFFFQSLAVRRKKLIGIICPSLLVKLVTAIVDGEDMIVCKKQLGSNTHNQLIKLFSLKS